MTDNRRNIKVKPETFEMLKRNKPEGVTWDYHLTQLQYAMDKENPHIPESYKEKLE